MPHVEIFEVIIVHCIIVNNIYQHDSRVLYTFSLNKSFGQLLDISPKNFVFLKTFNSEFSYIQGSHRARKPGKPWKKPIF